MKKNKFSELSREKILQEIANCQERWNAIKKHGCADPFWPDGTNMNLIRNHIICLKKLLQEKDKPNVIQLSLFPSSEDLGDNGNALNVPPEVNGDFMSPESRANYPNRLCYND